MKARLTGRPTFMWKTGDPEMATPKRVRTHRPKHSNTSLSREKRIWQMTQMVKHLTGYQEAVGSNTTAVSFCLSLSTIVRDPDD